MADDPILFNPENRLLGSSTGDLSLYGGQSDDGFVIREARPDADVAAPTPFGGPVVAPPSALSGTNPAHAESLSEAVPSDAVLPGAGAPASFLISSPATAFQAPAPQGEATTTTATTGVTAFTPAPRSSEGVPQPTGSGSTAPVPPLGSDAAATPGVDSVSHLTPSTVPGVVAPTLDAAHSLVEGLVQTPAAIVGAVPDLVQGVAETLPEAVQGLIQVPAAAVEAVAEAAPALVDQVVVPALGATTDLVEGVAQVPAAVTVSTITPVLDGAATLIDTVGQAPAAVSDAVVDPLLEAVESGVEAVVPTPIADAVVSPTLGLVGDVAEGLGQTVDAGAGGVVAPAVSAVAEPLEALAAAPAAIAQGVVSPIVDTVGDAVSATVGAVGDTLEGVAGSDPDAGVATLVSLVSVTDMFDLHPTEVAGPEPASDPGFGTLDLLAADDSDSSLLGGHHDDHSGSDGGSDHHPFGL